MVKFTQRDLAIVAGLAGVVDILTEHRFSIPVERAVKRALGKAIPFVGRAAVRQPVAMAGTARLIAMRHPVATGLAVAYVAYTEREKIQALLEQGYEIVEPAVQPVQEFLREEVFTEERLQRGREITQPIGSPFAFRPKRKPSKFNKAVSAGMKAVKKSKSYGGIGNISPATKVFSIVTKLASAKKKKKKAPKKGIRRLIWNAMKGLR